MTTPASQNNAFNTSGPSLTSKELKRGEVAPLKKNGPLVTTSPHTTRLIHELRPVRRGNI